MYSFIRNIITTYNETGTKRLTKPARVTSVAKIGLVPKYPVCYYSSGSSHVLALAALGPTNLTLKGAMLDKLAALPTENAVQASAEPQAQGPKLQHADIDRTAPPIKGPKISNGTRTSSITPIDFLSDDVAALRQALTAAPAVARWLADALKIFGEMEMKTRDLVIQHLRSKCCRSLYVNFMPSLYMLRFGRNHVKSCCNL